MNSVLRQRNFTPTEFRSTSGTNSVLRQRNKFRFYERNKFRSTSGINSVLHVGLCQVSHDFVDQVKLQRLLSGHEVVTIGMFFDFFKRFAGVQHL